MKLLLDTQVMLWWLGDDARLSTPTRDHIVRAEDVRVSAASVWEISIRRAQGRLELPEDYVGYIEQAGFRPLAITIEHADAAGSMPRHHDDPFDRMLAAQAWLEGLTLVTADRRLAAYDIAVLVAT